TNEGSAATRVCGKAKQETNRPRNTIMADETGKKPDKEGGAGTEKQGGETEAGGRWRHRLLYTCWNDGAGNYVHANWSWFTCWRCGAELHVIQPSVKTGEQGFDTLPFRVFSRL